MPKVKKEKTIIKKTAKPKVKVEAKTKKFPVKARILKSKAPVKAAKPKPQAHGLVSTSIGHKVTVKKAKEEAKQILKPVKPVVKHKPQGDGLASFGQSHAPKIEARVEQIKPEIKIEPKQETKPITKPQDHGLASVGQSHKPEEKVQVTFSVEPTPIPEEKAEIVASKEIELELPITVKDLAIKLQEKSSVLIKHLMGMGVMIGINQSLDEATLDKLCLKYDFKIKKALTAEELILQEHKRQDLPQELKSRSPIVTFMGHVDHGKTSLLDAIRKTRVTEAEHGGITQHIGAYRVSLPQGDITFLDTPGHEAFTAMRARGAAITDIVVLVVAADDGIMPQTQEAIDHARAAGVTIIVAINKIDKAQANVDTVKKQLSEVGLMAEDWGGKTITVPVSAKTGQGIDNLLEMILLQAEVMELKANPNRLAYGVVVEARMAKGRGPVATLLMQNGTLSLNQNIIVGNLYGKIRAMLDDRGHGVTAVGPASPVEVLGISGIPQVGEQFFAIEDEKQAKSLIEARTEKDRQQQVKEVKRISLEDLHAQIAGGKIKELKLIIKADVQGSLEAIKDILEKLNVSEIKINIIHMGAGNINTSDVVLAMASDALILGFNVTADEPAKELISKEGVDLKTYSIIYELGNDIKAAVEGMLAPKLKRVFLGRAEVRKMFKLSRSGLIAGCFVTKGKINRNCMVTVLRNGAVAFEGKLASLKRFKDDVREVGEGFECGIAIGGFDQLMEADIIEAYDIEKIARKL
ncbi:MAG: translation initiation factor IF-2 [Candidatus Omnitrophica bacterium]|nr:translation initiation factor IF-2 [Candidatus Omnitrophota bacterium]